MTMDCNWIAIRMTLPMMRYKIRDPPDAYALWSSSLEDDGSHIVLFIIHNKSDPRPAEATLGTTLSSQPTPPAPHPPRMSSAAVYFYTSRGLPCLFPIIIRLHISTNHLKHSPPVMILSNSLPRFASRIHTGRHPYQDE